MGLSPAAAAAPWLRRGALQLATFCAAAAAPATVGASWGTEARDPQAFVHNKSVMDSLWSFHPAEARDMLGRAASALGFKAAALAEEPQQRGPPPALHGHPGEHEAPQFGPPRLEFEDVRGPAPPALHGHPGEHEAPQPGPLRIEFEDARRPAPAGPAPGQHVHPGMPPELMRQHVRPGMPPELMRRHPGMPPELMRRQPGMPPEQMRRFEKVFPELAGAAPQTRRPVHGVFPFPGHQAGPPPGARSSGMGVDLFHDLFPGPLVVMEEPRGPGSMGLQGIQEDPFGAPDPLIMDMLQDLTGSFQNDMLPLIHNGANSSKRAPVSCRADLFKHCGAARSQVHCLGEHREDVSQACRQDVGKSVPFVCSRDISRFCNVLQQGILPCLSGRMDDVSGDCRDAVAATQEVIMKANTFQSSVVDVKTGVRMVHTPSVAPPSLAAAANGSAPPLGAQPTLALALARAPHQPGGLPAVPGALRAACAVCALLVFLYGAFFTDGWSRLPRGWKMYADRGECTRPLTGGIPHGRPVLI